MLQEKVEELDRILIDEELRFVRATKRLNTVERVQDGGPDRDVDLRDVFARDYSGRVVSKLPPMPGRFP